MQIQKLMLMAKELVKLKTILKQTQVHFMLIIQQKMDADIIDISTIHLNDSGSKSRPTNFGGGIELLMNEKKKEGKSSGGGDIHLDDLNTLEDELNDLTEEVNSKSYDA
jgi:hypothetical protein